jgi:precorrin-2 dehydrogenase/sirohydrochlorin ferrochelatase
MNNYYPLLINLKDKKCIVVGGGKVAERKVKSLLLSKASVTVISPSLTEGLYNLLKENKIFHINRKYKRGDLQEVYLAIAATSDGDVNRMVHREGKEQGIMVNVADSPDLCDFIVPAVIRRGLLTLTVSTGGKCPALARKIKKDISEIYGEEYGPLTSLIGDFRERLKSEVPWEEDRKKILRKFLEYDILGLLKKDRKKEVEKIMNKCLSDYKDKNSSG